MTLRYANSVTVQDRSAFFFDITPANFLQGDELEAVKNNRYFSCDVEIVFKFAARAGATGLVTVWWCPGKVRAFNTRMMHKWCLLNDQTTALKLILPTTDSTFFGGIDQHGIIAFGFKGVVPDVGANTLSVTAAMSLDVKNVVPRAPAPGLYEFKVDPSVKFEFDKLIDKPQSFWSPKALLEEKVSK